MNKKVWGGLALSGALAMQTLLFGIQAKAQGINDGWLFAKVRKPMSDS